MPTCPEQLQDMIRSLKERQHLITVMGASSGKAAIFLGARRLVADSEWLSLSCLEAFAGAAQAVHA